jgi:hypothetical protein
MRAIYEYAQDSAIEPPSSRANDGENVGRARQLWFYHRLDQGAWESLSIPNGKQRCWSSVNIRIGTAGSSRRNPR